MSIIPDSRVISFHEGQRWETPRGTVYEIVHVKHRGKAKIKNVANGRSSFRAWDGIGAGWFLVHDPLYPDHNK